MSRCHIDLIDQRPTISDTTVAFKVSSCFQEVSLYVVAVVLASSSHNVPVLKEAWGHARKLLGVLVSPSSRSSKSPINGLEHRVALSGCLWDGRMYHDFLHILQQRFVGLGHTTSYHTGKSIHTIQPGRPASYSTHSQGSRMANFRDQEEQLGNGRAHKGISVSCSLPVCLDSDQPVFWSRKASCSFTLTLSSKLNRAGT
jgi:hypothetical protein